jgi:hypothetical protein
VRLLARLVRGGTRGPRDAAGRRSSAPASNWPRKQPRCRPATACTGSPSMTARPLRPARSSSLSTIVLMPRTGPRPLVASGMLAAAGGAAWLAQLGPHTAYAAGVLGPIILASVGLGLVIAPVINTGTFGVAPPGRRRRIRCRHRRPAARRLGRYLAAEHHLRRRRHLLPRRAPRRGPAHRPPGADRAGAGARLRHRVLVDRRHLRRRRGHRRRPAPPRATAPGQHAHTGTRRNDTGTSQRRPRPSQVISLAQIPGIPDAGDRRTQQGYPREPPSRAP